MVDRRAKKAEKRRKKRDATHRGASNRTASGSTALSSTSKAAFIQEAASCPVGQCYISRNWDAPASPMPSLVMVVLPRSLPHGRIAAGVAMVDRTCIGVKNGFVTRPLLPRDFDRLLKVQMGALHGGMVPCDLLVAQSIVYHGVDYARRLGFEPHPDFPERLFGPRPAVLLDTPHCNVAKPNYVSGPDDDVPWVLSRLDQAVGRDNYHFTVAAEQLGVGGDARLLRDGGEIGEDQDDDEDDK